MVQAIHSGLNPIDRADGKAVGLAGVAKAPQVQTEFGSGFEALYRRGTDKCNPLGKTFILHRFRRRLLHDLQLP